MGEEDKESLLNVETKVYKRRWYILFLFSFLALFQCTIFNTWGPIVTSLPLVYTSWTEATIGLLANWCCIAFLVFMVPVLYLQNYSLRSAVLLSSSLVALATSIRCTFLIYPGIDEETFTILAHIGAILNGIPSIVVTSAPPAVSAAWFPANERVTATSISQMLNNVGQGLSFLIASLIVEPPHQDHLGNTTSATTCDRITPSQQGHSLDISHLERDKLKNEINTYMLVLCAPALFIFFCSVIYFPSKPPKPPSRSSSEARLDFMAGAKQLLTNPASWLLAIVWSVPQAVWNNWCAMMVISLTKVGHDGSCLSEHWVNYLGLVAVLVGTFVAILVGMATDRIRGKMKISIVILLTMGGLMFTTLSLISLQIIQFPSMVSLQFSVYLFLLLGNSCVVSTSPLLFEFGVEKLYPVSEGMIGGWMNIWYNIISVLFLGLFDIPGIGTQWLNYVLPLSCFFVLPIFLTLKEEYRRRVLDEDSFICYSDEESSEDDEKDLLAEEEEVQPVFISEH